MKYSMRKNEGGQTEISEKRKKLNGRERQTETETETETGTGTEREKSNLKIDNTIL